MKKVNDDNAKILVPLGCKPIVLFVISKFAGSLNINLIIYNESLQSRKKLQYLPKFIYIYIYIYLYIDFSFSQILYFDFFYQSLLDKL